MPAIRLHKLKKKCVDLKHTTAYVEFRGLLYESLKYEHDLMSLKGSIGLLKIF